MRHAGIVAVWAVLAIGSAEGWAETGQAVLRDTREGSTVVNGTATLTDTPQGLQVHVQVSGAPAGQHGVHIHEFGACGDLGKAAGGHFNPEGAPHGFLPKDGHANAHGGDMGNIEVGADGAGTLAVTLPGVNLGGGKDSVGGRAIILHEKADDFGQPTGNAGGRIGCGTIVITGS